MLLYVIVVLYLNLVSAQKPSPCPDVLAYEQRGAEEDRYYGWITVANSPPLSGIWLRIMLDEPAELIGNWFGAPSTKDYKTFLIKNREFQFDPNVKPLSLRFFVKYNTNGNVPSVIGLKLNGNTICPVGAGEVTTKLPALFLSQSRTSQITTTPQPVTQAAPVEEDSEDYVFPSDFARIRRPLLYKLSGNGVGGNTCGIVKRRARPLITYGQSTTEGDWPWHAALYRSVGINLRYICGGSLISPNHIITAAHCVTRINTEVTVNPNLFTVYLGKYNLYGLGSNVQSRSVSKITIHPDFKATNFQNDIAIMRLESPIDITDFVNTVCLWDEDVDLNSVIEKLGTVVGWGLDQTGNLTETLMQAKMPVVSTQTCIFSNREFFSIFASEKTYCAGFRNGTSVCTGDSGGGMVFPKTSTNGQNTVWQLRGIISLSTALQNENIGCDTSNYVLFTDVAKYLDWVREVMKT